MRRALLQLLGLLAASPCFGQRAPTRSPASPTDSLRAAWTPESITVDRPHGPTGLDSPAVIRFHNGQRFATGLYNAKFLGILPSSKTPYVVLSGRGCDECDANISIYILSPLGPPVREATTDRYWSPGQETDRETGKIIRKSRAFIGHCLPDPTDAIIWYDNLASDQGPWRTGLSLVRIVADTVASELRTPPPSISATLRLVGLGACREIPGLAESSEP